MSSASLAVVHRAHPDPVRIAAFSTTLALNLVALTLALRPMTPRLAQVFRSDPSPVVRLIEPPAVVPPPPPIVLKSPPHPVPGAHVPPTPVAAPVVVPSNEGRIAAPPVHAATLQPPGNVTTTTDTPIEASLAYRTAPLHFPAQALRQRMQGTVLLRVLVDETGKPVEVEIAQGSGYALLDRSAREQVLANWRFQPAVVNGHAVRAWAQVPVSFALREL